MKILFLLMILLLSEMLFNVTAQVDTVWTRRFNGPANTSDNGSIIKVDENGFVYVGCQVSRNASFAEAAVIKYNPNGDQLWIRYYNSPYNLESYLYDMVLDADGNIIITGSSAGVNYSDCFIEKFNSNGDSLWSARYDDGDLDVSFSIAVDNSGNVFTTGTSWIINYSYNFLTLGYNSGGNLMWTYNWAGPEGAQDISKDIALDNSGNLIFAGTCDWHWGTIDYVTIKCYQTGDTSWIRKYDSYDHGQDYLKTVAVDANDNIYVTGDSYKPGGNHDIITIKYNSNGDSLWTRRYNGVANGDDIVWAMAVDSAGNMYLAGSSFVAGNGIDFLTMKYNSDGVLMWVKTHGEYSYHSDGANSIAIDNSGNVYVTGSVSTSSSNLAYITIKYDNNGNEKWVKKYNGPAYNGFDAGNSICVDNSGFVYVTGSSAGITSGSDALTIKYEQGTSAVNGNNDIQPANYLLLQNYPNPFNPSTKISWQSPVSGHQTLKVFDVLGNEIATLVDEYKQAGRYEVEFPASSLSGSASAKGGYASGVYFYQLKVGKYLQTRKMILMK